VRGVFFTVARRAFQLSDLIGEGNKLFGQTIEEAEIFDVLFDLLGLSRGNAFGALLALKETLKDEVGARLYDLALAPSLEELATEGTAPQVVDLLHTFQNCVALRTESLD
jgi:hypothetical protein